MSRRRSSVVLSMIALVGAAALVPSGAGAVAPVDGRADTSTVGFSTERRGMPDVWWYDAMKLDEVHRTATGKGVKVAVIDGYLDPRIPDLRGAKISKGTGCRDGATPYLSGELASHGTAMTTAIVGQGANGRGIVGVAPDAQLRFYSFDTDPKQSLVECDAILIQNQVEKAVAWGADVISMSIGTGGGLEEAIETAWKSDVVVVAASGAIENGANKETQPMARPAQMPGVVSVSAADSRGRVWSGNPKSADFLDAYLTVGAPGVDVPLGGFRAGSDQWLTGAERTGSSPATAIVAGAFAVLRSRWPDATNNQLIQAVIHAASGEENKGELRYDDYNNGYGTLKLLGTMDRDPGGWPDENPLLLPPPQAMKKYPASSYQDPAAASQEATDGATEEDQGAQPKGDAAATDERSASQQDASDAGVPVWAFVLGGVVLLAILAGGLVLARRSRPTAGHQTPDDVSSTTNDHTAPRGS